MVLLKDMFDLFSDKGSFFFLFYNATARVKISEMSDLHIKDWKSIYKVGQLVKGKITNLEAFGLEIEKEE